MYVHRNYSERTPTDLGVRTPRFGCMYRRIQVYVQTDSGLRTPGRGLPFKSLRVRVEQRISPQERSPNLSSKEAAENKQRRAMQQNKTEINQKR